MNQLWNFLFSISSVNNKFVINISTSERVQKMHKFSELQQRLHPSYDNCSCNGVLSISFQYSFIWNIYRRNRCERHVLTYGYWYSGLSTAFEVTIASTDKHGWLFVVYKILIHNIRYLHISSPMALMSNQSLIDSSALRSLEYVRSGVRNPTIR